MRHFNFLMAAVLLAAVLFSGANVMAQTESVTHGPGFVDANGDGYNDNAPDSDGDGIPNGLDPDYVRTGTGRGPRGGFIDTDGDGINDRSQDFDGDGIINAQDPDWTSTLSIGKGLKQGGGKGGLRGSGRGSRGAGMRGGRGNGTGVCQQIAP